MKFAQKTFPKGTFPKQQKHGAYMNDYLASNLDTYAEKIADDMHFTLIIAGNDSVGNGKSTMATHVGCYLTWKANKEHKLKNTFKHENMVFKAKDLVETSFRLPKYSVIVLDEGDDLTEHSMKTIAKELKKYFRKCRQLNQILILILPMFFELPRFYALGRSHCLINVKFKRKFERGHFDFYGPNKKKELYLKGKREWNYNVIQPDFSGQFFASYCFFPNVNEEVKLYKYQKFRDMIDDNGDELSTKEQLKKQKINYFQRMHIYFPKLLIRDLCEALDISRKMGSEYLKEIKKNLKISRMPKSKKWLADATYNNILNRDESIFEHSRSKDTIKDTIKDKGVDDTHMVDYITGGDEINEDKNR